MKHRYLVAFHTPLEWMPYYFRWNRQWMPLVVWYLGYSVFALFCGAVFLICSVLFPLMVSSIRVGLLASLGTILWACYLHFTYLKWYDTWDDRIREAYLGRFWTSRFGMLPVRYYADHQRLRLALWYVAYSGIVAAGYGLLGLCGVALSYGADHSRYGWVVTVFFILWLGVVLAAIVIRHVRNVLSAPEPTAKESETDVDWLDAQDPSDAAMGNPILLVGNPRQKRQAEASTPAREEIEAVIVLSDAAWKAGDFADFETAWDFSVLKEHVSRERWRAALAEQTERWFEWRSNIIDIWPSDHVGIPVNASSMHLVPVPLGSVQVTVEVSAIRSDGEPWTGRTMYVVTPSEAGARIVYWTMLDVETGLL